MLFILFVLYTCYGICSGVWFAVDLCLNLMFFCGLFTDA